MMNVFFEDGLAEQLAGKTLLVGITHTDVNGMVLSESKVFGHVIVANRVQGICIFDSRTSKQTWLPPDTRVIAPAPTGIYRNRFTGEIVRNPDFIAAWVVSELPENRNASVN